MKEHAKTTEYLPSDWLVPPVGLQVPSGRHVSRKIALMLVVFILFALLPLLAAASQGEAASNDSQLDYPCALLPPDSLIMDNLGADIRNQAGFIEALAQSNEPFNYSVFTALGEEAHRLVAYNWSRYCEQKNAPAWTVGNYFGYAFEFPDGGGAGQQPWASWRPDLISTASLRSVRRERQSTVWRSA